MAQEIVLAFDFGMNRIGVAVGQRITGTASALMVLEARDGVPDWERVQALLEEWDVRHVVVGLPLNMDGTSSDMAALAEKFGRKLHGRFGVAVDMVDERLTTREARERAREQGLPESAPVDAVAAQIILETWLAAP